MYLLLSAVIFGATILFEPTAGQFGTTQFPPFPPFPEFGCEGDPHYDTFDGLSYDFQGTCTYVLAETSNDTYYDEVPALRVLSTNNYPNEDLRKERQSAPKNVRVELYGNNLTFTNGPGTVEVNGALENLPYFYGTISSRNIQVRQQTDGVYLVTDFGVTVAFTGTCGSNYCHIIMRFPNSLFNKTSGMAGNFDGNPNNDLELPDGTLITDATLFGNSWKDPELSKATCDDGTAALPDCTAAENTQVINACSAMSNPNGPFKNCHAKLSPTRFVNNCEYDYCADFDRTEFLCASFLVYAARCAFRGVIVNWRTNSFCPTNCKGNTHYALSTPPCASSCSEPTATQTCGSVRPVSGCVCDAGFILSGNECVKPEQCGCTGPEGNYHKKGDTWFPSCSQQCTCNGPNNMDCTFISFCPGQLSCVDRNNAPTCLCVFGPFCAEQCSVSLGGVLRNKATFGSQLPLNAKTVLARTDNSVPNQCRLKVVVRTNLLGEVDWAAVSAGIHPTKPDNPIKYAKNFAFDLWENKGAYLRGPKLNNLKKIVFPFAGWNDGSIYVTVVEVNPGSPGWRLVATCGTGPGAEELLTFQYAAGTAEYYVSLSVNQPDRWTEICYDVDV